LLPVGSRGVWLTFALCVVLRVALFPFAENKHGDAPMRALIAERMVLEPSSAADPRTYCQFGPLHTALMRPFVALDRYAPRSTRYLSLLAGIAVFFPFLALAGRLVGRPRASLAAFLLAVSPLHLQASTTAASEALYLLLWVGAIERLLAALDGDRGRDFALAGLLASLAAVTRYDAWLALPLVVLAAALFRPEGRRVPLGGLALFSLSAAALPAIWLGWGARVGGDALFFAHYISADHAELAATAVARYGPVLGRLRQVGVWALGFVAAMTLPGAVLAGVALARGWKPLPRPMRLVIVAALGPPAIYLARGLVLQSFEPLARFALVPGTLLLPLAVGTLPPTRERAFRVGSLAAAALFSVVIWLVATVGRERIWAGAESMGALTRLDGEDRALARYLRAQRPPGAPVMIEPLAFADIGIEHAAGIPWTEAISLIVTREPRDTVAETLRATGARFLVGYDRDGGWPRRLPDWPARAVRFGHWRLLAR
jgi:4-amino-4-deoxy-L-arabinose transferase-like glycosyltransferase